VRSIVFIGSSARADQRQDAQRQHRVALAHEELQTPDRRVPGHIQRLDPDDRAIRQQDDVDQDAGPERFSNVRHLSKLASSARRIGVALHRPLVQQRDDQRQQAQRR
jgi:hypothetical protein